MAKTKKEIPISSEAVNLTYRGKNRTFQLITNNKALIKTLKTKDITPAGDASKPYRGGRLKFALFWIPEQELNTLVEEFSINIQYVKEKRARKSE